MSDPHSRDLRERVVQYVAEGGGKRAAARHFRISPSSAVKLAKRWSETGRISPDARGRPGGGGKLAGQLDYLQARLAERPDLTMPELADKLARERGVSVDPASVSRFLCRNAITYKKRR